MEYDATAKERLTGRAYFNPQIPGGTGITSSPWLDLGNIQMMSLDYGIKRKEHLKARRGLLFTDRDDAYSATPRWEITGDEFTSTTLFLIFLGTNATAFVQTTSSSSFSISVHKGGVYSVGKVALYNASLATGVEGYTRDYVIDRGPGMVYFPMSSTFTENSTVNLTCSWPTVTYDTIFPPLSNLNRNGLMRLIEEDDSPPTGTSTLAAPKTIHDFAVSLSTDSGGTTKVDEFKTFKIIATITDPVNWTVLKRNT